MALRRGYRDRVERWGRANRCYFRGWQPLLWTRASHEHGRSINQSLSPELQWQQRRQSDASDGIKVRDEQRARGFVLGIDCIFNHQINQIRRQCCQQQLPQLCYSVSPMLTFECNTSERCLIELCFATIRCMITRPDGAKHAVAITAYEGAANPRQLLLLSLLLATAAATAAASIDHANRVSVNEEQLASHVTVLDAMQAIDAEIGMMFRTQLLHSIRSISIVAHAQSICIDNIIRFYHLTPQWHTTKRLILIPLHFLNNHGSCLSLLCLEWIDTMD